ncbi:hypothetical protein AB670_03982 [Chryseobacterium sp. MOF25P]|nr:hypothetical protein AB670_03982 [Chryseobacterium sp. MOF25P]OBW43778.1 hypothetical protein AB671_04133 [Chryseobacterium sp. BGARF1]
MSTLIVNLCRASNRRIFLTFASLIFLTLSFPMLFLQLTKQHLCHSDQEKTSTLFFAITKISSIQRIGINKKVKLDIKNSPPLEGWRKILYFLTGWLIRIMFNDKTFQISHYKIQIILHIKITYSKDF